MSHVLCDDLNLHPILHYIQPTSELELLSDVLTKQQPLSDIDAMFCYCCELINLTKLASVIGLDVLKIILNAINASCSCNQNIHGLEFSHLQSEYSLCHSAIDHQNVGRESTLHWIFVTITRQDVNWKPPSIRASYPLVTNFNMIGDKIGGGFNPIPQQAWFTMGDSNHEAWDLSLDPEKTEYWVQCPLRFSLPASPSQGLWLSMS